MSPSVLLSLQPLPGSGTTTNDLRALATADGRKVLKVYRTRDRWRRSMQERAVLEVWRRHGFRVPEVYDLRLPRVPQPYLVMEWVSGITLQDLLRSAGYSPQQKLDVLDRVYAEMQRRHEMAFASGELRLVHPDPNTGNVILAAGAAVWLDLEDEARSRDVAVAAAAEIVKLTCWAVSDWSIDYIEPICQRLRHAYRGREGLLALLWRRTCERPFQFIHRWLDRRRKRAVPGIVTKYDIADALRPILEQSPSQSPAVPTPAAWPARESGDPPARRSKAA